jgi:hypothetical protein
MNTSRETFTRSPEDYVDALPHLFYAGEGKFLHEVATNVKLPLSLRIRATDAFLGQYKAFNGKNHLEMLSLVGTLPRFSPRIRQFATLLDVGLKFDVAACLSGLGS